MWMFEGTDVFVSVCRHPQKGCHSPIFGTNLVQIKTLGIPAYILPWTPITKMKAPQAENNLENSPSLAVYRKFLMQLISLYSCSILWYRIRSSNCSIILCWRCVATSDEVGISCSFKGLEIWGIETSHECGELFFSLAENRINAVCPRYLCLAFTAISQLQKHM